ncbi:MAG TPA: M14 family zinc carboxypeptidase [Thermoanaerobaculia bacterium]|nr:M14 family zinc carboxypeptidase [Thermoanaerobaculia bacterium]
MTPKKLAAQLFNTSTRLRRSHLRPGTCRHEAVTAEIRRLVERSGGLLAIREAGRSIEGRPVPIVSFGRGPKSILLWTQMHGDEPTATLAFLDILDILTGPGGRESWAKEILARTTVHAIPMLNPDGAERARRLNAAGIDINRDALALVSPEARILREAQRQLRPDYAFNLHDQPLASAGPAPKVTALSLLSPACDEKRSTPPVRLRAMKLGALVVNVLRPFVSGHLATYDDSFLPRAFGDAMQSWGTSTLLVESGHWPKDPEKRLVRRLNVAGILAAMHAIGSGTVERTSPSSYLRLPQNGKGLFDVLVRNVMLQVRSSGWTGKVDVGLAADPPRHTRADPSAPVLVRVQEIGDLGAFGGLEVLDARERSLPYAAVSVGRVLPLTRIVEAVRMPRPRGR